jgi:carbon-monoxide dehydrogenase small subunit
LELTERFVVPATVDQVWQLFDDVPEVVTCMPGAEVTERVDEKTYNARLTISVGPIRPKFDVKAEIERDEATREGRIIVHAIDKRGGSQARGQIVYRLSQATDEPGTAVELVQNVNLSGPLAQFGRTGVIEDINAQMTRQFAQCLASKLGNPPTPAAENGADTPAAAVETPIESPPAATSNEIKIIPLLARTVSGRILRLLRLRK